MSKRLFSALVFGVLSTSMATATLAADFMEIDTNRDGFVSLAELSVAGVPITQEIYSAADANQDNLLDEAEFGTLAQ
ncbi:hypothetical protein [Labrenzia sp. DG1229]|uniref:hypothetical protein n=1 Tax=Labrenzia sp. DG1229 TaxID=681847 RepID=UPI00048CBAD9|nr:hypothetical protein [Labrenzia sp. DG1229]